MRMEIENLTKTIKKRNILDDISLTVEGIYGLIGPNGAGKTTLMKILAGLQKLTAGSIKIDDQHYVHRHASYITVNTLIGYLPQDFMIYPEISVYEVLDHIAVLQGIVKKSERQQQIEEALAIVNLSGQQHKKMNELSGGMRRRVGIAQLLMRKPSILLFDEPTAGLDIEERIRFRNLLLELGKQHTVVISSHIVEDIEFLCTKIGILTQGQLRFEGTPEELKQRADGYVYHMDVQAEGLSELLMTQDVTQINEEEQHLKVRIFSTEALGQPRVIPRLMEGYLAVVRGVDNGK